MNNRSTPLVSVIIPTYNREKMVGEAICSVLNQTYEHYELIVVDDGSTDNTSKVFEEYRDDLTILYQENQGPSAARNTGINAARGSLIAFLDSDDIWKSKKLEVQVNYMLNHPEVNICQTEEIWIRNGVRVNPMKKHKKYSGWIFDKMVSLCIVSPSAVMLKKDLFAEVGLFDEALLACEDYDLWLRIGLLYPIELIHQPLVVKRGGHSDQQSRSFWGMDRFRVKALVKLLNNKLLSDSQRKQVVDELVKKCKVLAVGCEKHGRLELVKFYNELIRRYQRN